MGLGPLRLPGQNTADWLAETELWFFFTDLKAGKSKIKVPSVPGESPLPDLQTGTFFVLAFS